MFLFENRQERLLTGHAMAMAEDFPVVLRWPE